MKSTSALISAIILSFSVHFAASVAEKHKSHWCPTLEIRRVSCVKNVSLHGEPANLRRVYQWKKEMVFRCCPGFMGPNCEKACFSCQQWAELVGKVHHMEQYLKGSPAAGIVSHFQPFTPDTSANTVCWTKDGRPVYAHFSPPNFGGRATGDGRGASGGGEGERGYGMERSRIYARRGAQSASSNINGCPIHTGSRGSSSSRRDGGSSSSGGDRSSPHRSMNPARHQQQGYRQPQKQRRISIKMDARRLEKRHDSPMLQGKGHSEIPPRSTYQKYPPLPFSSNRKRVAPSFRTRDSSMDIPPGQFVPAPNPTPMKQIIRRRYDVGDEDIAEIRERYTERLVKDTAYDQRLTTLERQMVQLEEKLSALSPTLAIVTSLKEDINLLAKQLHTLQLQSNSNVVDSKTSHPVGDDLTSGSKETAVSHKQNGNQEAGTNIDEPQQIINNEERQDGKNTKTSAPKHRSTRDENTSESNNASCKARCEGSSPPPPLPDKDVVQALFPHAPSVAEALDKGPQEFYNEVKKVIKHQKVPIVKESPGYGHFESQQDEQKKRQKSDARNSIVTDDDHKESEANGRGLNSPQLQISRDSESKSAPHGAKGHSSANSKYKESNHADNLVASGFVVFILVLNAIAFTMRSSAWNL